MKLRVLKRLAAAGAIATSAALLLGGGVGQAANLGQGPQFFTGTGVNSFRAAGSETTYYVMNAVGNLYSQTSIYGCTLKSVDFRTCDTTKDGSATDVLDDYSRNEFVNGLGNGSGNGIGQMCGVKPTGGQTVDFARASRAVSASDLCPTAVNEEFARDGVAPLDFPNVGYATLSCTGTCSASQVGPVAAGWRPGDPFAGPYTGVAFAGLSNTASAVLGNKSLAFRLYCDKGGRTTDANVSFSTASAGRSVTDAITYSGSQAGILTSASANFASADIGSLVTGTNIPSSTYIKQVIDASDVALTNNATAAGTGQSVTIAPDGTAVSSGTNAANPSGEFSGGDVNQSITGTGIPPSTTIAALYDNAHIRLSQAVTSSQSNVAVTIGGSGFAINDWGQLTDPTPDNGTTKGAEGIGTPASPPEPIYFPFINTGSGTYSVFKGYVGCDPNTKNKDGQVAQENDAPQLTDIANLDAGADNIAASNQLAEGLYYISYGVSLWHPYTLTTGQGTALGSQQGTRLKVNGVLAGAGNILNKTLATYRPLEVVWNTQKLRASVAGFINWMCDTDPGKVNHGLDLTTGNNYSTELTNTIQTTFNFPRVPCAVDGSGNSTPPIVAANITDMNS